MTKEIKYYKEKEYPLKWIPVEEMEETPQQTIARLEQENKELKAYKDVNEDFKKAWDELNKKYTEVLKLAKTNADSNEYCLQELEKENKELKTCIEMIKNTEGQAHIEGVRLAKENKELKELNKKICEDWTEQIKYYWEALEEIRIIADDTLKVCDDDCVNSRKIKLILDKIEEVLNDNR